MRLGWAALPVLVAMPACSPVKDYQEAARSLRFTLERVRPDLQLALPLERSRVGFALTLRVVNPSGVAFHLRGFEGAFRLDTGDGARPLGQATLLRPLDLPARGEADLDLELGFTYQDLADRWPDLVAALRGERAGAWELAGTVKGVVHGIPVQAPVHARRSFGAAP
jgi:LEA14-like dessication related protein